MNNAPYTLTVEELQRLALSDLIALARYYRINFNPNLPYDAQKSELVTKLSPTKSLDVWDVPDPQIVPPKYSARVKRIMEQKDHE